MSKSVSCLQIGTYRPDWTAGPSRSRVVGDPNGIAPRRAAAPVPRAEMDTHGSPARARMLIAALWSAFARNPQAPAMAASRAPVSASPGYRRRRTVRCTVSGACVVESGVLGMKVQVSCPMESPVSAGLSHL